MDKGSDHPSIPECNQVIRSYVPQKAFAQKQKNEAEAEKVLSRIDDYLMKELGIKLPEPPDNILKNRMFTVSRHKVSRIRFDPHFRKEIFKQLDKSFQKVLFIISNLKRQSILITSGATPLSKGDAYTEKKSRSAF